jgi:hypothetical protein
MIIPKPPATQIAALKDVMNIPTGLPPVRRLWG